MHHWFMEKNNFGAANSKGAYIFERESVCLESDDELFTAHRDSDHAWHEQTDPRFNLTFGWCNASTDF